MTLDRTETISAFAGSVRDCILATMGRERLRSVFVTGSVARGTIAAYESDGGLEIYSDLDVHVVVGPGVDAEAAKQDLRRAVVELPLTGAGYVFFSPPDIGVYTMADLMAQPARPGTVDMGTAHLTLWGDAGIPARAAARIGTEIVKGEALYLIENRLNELADVLVSRETGPGPGSERYAHYVLAKAGLDAATALLVFAGKYDGNRRERARVLPEIVAGEGLTEILDEGLLHLVEACARAVEDLQGYLSNPPISVASQRKLVEGALVRLWRLLAGRIYDASTWSAVLLARCQAGRRGRNLRELLAMARKMHVPRLKTYIRSPGLAYLSPVETVRMSSLVDAAARQLKAGQTIDPTYTHALDGLTRAFGFGDGDLFARGRALCRATS